MPLELDLESVSIYCWLVKGCQRWKISKAESGGRGLSHVKGPVKKSKELMKLGGMAPVIPESERNAPGLRSRLFIVSIIESVIIDMYIRLHQLHLVLC